MIAVRVVARPSMIEELEKELAKVIEDFDRAVNVETLQQTKKIGEPSSCPSRHISF